MDFFTAGLPVVNEDAAKAGEETGIPLAIVYQISSHLFHTFDATQTGVKKMTTQS